MDKFLKGVDTFCTIGVALCCINAVISKDWPQAIFWYLMTCNNIGAFKSNVTLVVKDKES